MLGRIIPVSARYGCRFLVVAGGGGGLRVVRCEILGENPRRRNEVGAGGLLLRLPWNRQG